MYFPFMCSINPTDFDARMEQEPAFDINFCLKLPQSVHDIKNNIVLADLWRKRHVSKVRSVERGLSKLLGG